VVTTRLLQRMTQRTLRLGRDRGVNHGLVLRANVIVFVSARFEGQFSFGELDNANTASLPEPELRAVMHYVERVSALFMIVAGSYIIYYSLVTSNLIDAFT